MAFKLQFHKFGTSEHEQLERVAAFRESAASISLAAAIDRAQTALADVDKILDREKMTEPKIKEFIKVLATIKVEALCAVGTVAESKRTGLAYLRGMAD